MPVSDKLRHQGRQRSLTWVNPLKNLLGIVSDNWDLDSVLYRSCIVRKPIFAYANIFAFAKTKPTDHQLIQSLYFQLRLSTISLLPASKISSV